MSGKPMRIASVEDLHADGGWRDFSYLKLTTDEGLVGWSEYSERGWSQGITSAIRGMAHVLTGSDPRQVSRISADLTARARMAPGGINQQAIAAIENACLDVTAKSMGVPVYALLGGAVRDRLRVYWSHCGTFRASHGDYFERVLGLSAVRRLDDLRQLGKSAAARGYTALKTNPIVFSRTGADTINPGFSVRGLDHGRNAGPEVLDAIADQLSAMREGAGSRTELLLDVNFSFSPESLRRVASQVEGFRLLWLEADMHDPAALAAVRRSTSVPIGSLETIYGRRGYRPYLEQQAVDVAIIDAAWNGALESRHIASLAETYEVNIAPHNFTSHLATMMSAHLCAAVPNFRIMEIEVDDVPWKDALVSPQPLIEQGDLVVPDKPGWGVEVNEQAVREHPGKRAGVPPL